MCPAQCDFAENRTVRELPPAALHMSKFVIHGPFARDKFVDVLPAAYQGPAMAVTRPGIEYLIVQFPLPRDAVVTSRSVRKAIPRVPAGIAVLAVGANFTAEAMALLSELDAVVARLGDFYWTDASYASIKQ